MNNKSKKLGFFDQVIYSVQPSRFGELTSQPKSRIIRYAIILFLCLTIMNFVIPLSGFLISVGGYDVFVTEGLPEIELKDGALSVEHRIETGENSVSHILVDTSIERATESHLDTENYIAEIIIAKENILVYNGGANAVELDFDDFAGVTINNAGLIELKPLVYFVIAISFFSSFATQAFNYLFTAAFLALLCWGPFSVQGAERMKYTKVLAFAIYAKTAPELLIAFNNSAGIISNDMILSYGAIAVTFIILANGLRCTAEEKKHE